MQRLADDVPHLHKLGSKSDAEKAAVLLAFKVLKICVVQLPQAVHWSRWTFVGRCAAFLIKWFWFGVESSGLSFHSDVQCQKLILY